MASVGKMAFCMVFSVKSFKLTNLNYRKGKPGSFSKGRPGPPEPKKTLLGRRVDQSQER